MNAAAQTAEEATGQMALDLGWSEPTGFGALDPRERVFVREYLACGNGAEAARRAGYSEVGAKQQASAMLSRPDVRRVLDEAAHKAGVEAGRVIARNERAAMMWHEIARNEALTIKQRKAASDAARNHDAMLLAATGKANVNFNNLNFANQINGIILSPDVLATLSAARQKLAAGPTIEAQVTARGGEN